MRFVLAYPSTAPDCMDDFHAVAFGQHAFSMQAARHDLAIDLDRDALGGVTGFFQQAGDGDALGTVARRAVEEDLHLRILARQFPAAKENAREARASRASNRAWISGRCRPAGRYLSVWAWASAVARAAAARAAVASAPVGRVAGPAAHAFVPGTGAAVPAAVALPAASVPALRVAGPAARVVVPVAPAGRAGDPAAVAPVLRVVAPVAAASAPDRPVVARAVPAGRAVAPGPH